MTPDFGSVTIQITQDGPRPAGIVHQVKPAAGESDPSFAQRLARTWQNAPGTEIRIHYQRGRITYAEVICAPQEIPY